MRRRLKAQISTGVDLGNIAIRAARGDRPACDELYTNLAPVSWKVAYAATRMVPAATQAAIHGFIGLFRSINRGSPTEDVLVMLLQATRRAGLSIAYQQTGEQLGVGEPAVTPAGLNEDSAAILALAMLPEHYRCSLALTESTAMSAMRVARVLGLSPTNVGHVINRARADYRHYYAKALAQQGSSPTCKNALCLLTGYFVRKLNARDTAFVEDHLRSCARCRSVFTHLENLKERMNIAIPRLPPWTHLHLARAWNSAAP